MSSIGTAEEFVPIKRTLLDLTGQVAVVIGAGGGIGRCVAERLSIAGAKVLLNHRGQNQSVEETVSRLRDNGMEVVSVASRFASFEDAESVLATCRAKLGAATIIVNAAGSYRSATIAETSIDTWRQSVADNLETAFLAIKAAESTMSSGGSVILIASISAHIPAPSQAAYNAAKSGAIMLMKSAAQELGPRGIRVNSVSPGLIDREGLEQQWPEGVSSWTSKAPLRRLGHPEDVANACLFLASPAAGWITGHDLVVDGGMLTGPIY